MQELAEIEDILGQLKDKRAAQRFVTYDRIFLALLSAAEEYNIPLPKVFMSQNIDRTSITHFITNEEVTFDNINTHGPNLSIYVVE